MSVKIANSLYKQGRFQEAYNLYVELQERYGTSLFEANVSLCKKNMGYKSAFNEKNTQDLSDLNLYFDHIYVVNLKHKVKDKLTIAQHLKKNNICFEIFEATNGYEGEAYQKWLEYSKRPLGTFKRYKHFSDKEIKLRRSLIESAGAVGYIYTYLRILNDAKNKGYERFLILEDDVLLDNQFEEKFNNFTRNIDDHWKILLLGASQYGWNGIDEKESIDRGYYSPRRVDGNTTCGSFAIAFHKSVIEEMIAAASSFEAPFDHLPLGELYERHIGKCFVAYPNIVIADVEESTIRGKRSQVEQSRRIKWRLENFDFPLNKPNIALLINSERNLKYFDGFSLGKDRPFNLRVYFNTSSGIRPIHNVEVLSKPYNKIKNNYNQVDFLEADYIATVEKCKTLSEEDIIDYIEFKVGMKSNSNKLIDFKINKKSVFKKSRASVIIPTYKRVDNLKNAIDSVMSQDYGDIEIIVVSDNGKDSKVNKEVSKIIDSYSNTDSKINIKYLAHDFNRNGSAARNTGIMHSTGEYISFLDDDDIYLPGRLSKVIEKLKKSPKEVGAVYCGFLGWNSVDNNLGRYAEGDLTEYFLSLDYSKHYLHTNTATYRREAILNLNGFDESYNRHQDLEFNIRFFELYSILSLKEPLVKLKPEPVKNSNVLFDSEMIKLKEKFLGQFDYLIKSFCTDIQYKIYSAHVNETLKYIKEKDKAVKYYVNSFDDFNLKLFTKLIVSRNSSLALELDDSLNKNKYHKNDIGFYRIIGNNHSNLQSHEQVFKNLMKILEEEESFDNVDKYYVLNRITNLKLYSRIKDYLELKEVNYLEIDFDLERFSKIGYDLNNIPDPSIWFNEFDSWNRLVMNTEIRESKNRYLINNNGARNFSIEDGKKKHKWVMPWDGNCFITKCEFDTLKDSFKEFGKIKYIVTPMERIVDNETLSKSSEITNAVDEPQISFRSDALDFFNEARVYGNQPKVELFKRLGIKGKWDQWTKLSPWKNLEFETSIEAGLYQSSGATFRLSSGRRDATYNSSERNILRKQAIINYIDETEAQFIEQFLTSSSFANNLPDQLKGFIANSNIRKKHNKLTWHMGKAILSQNDLTVLEIRNQLISDFNDDSSFEDSIYLYFSLFSHSLVNDAVDLIEYDADTLCFIDNDFKTVFQRNKISVQKDFKSVLASVFIAQMHLISNGKLRDSVQLKLEVVVLIYYYANNIEIIGRDQKIYNIIYLINKVYKELYSYDLMRDLWSIGIDKNEIFL